MSVSCAKAGIGRVWIDGTEVTGMTKVETVIAANTITAAENGATFVLSLAAGFASTLPAPVEGLKFRFVCGTVPSAGDYTIVTSTAATTAGNLIDGMADVASTLVPAANESTITLGSAALSGDWVEVVSDGTNWYVSGQGVTTASIAFTATA